MNNLTNPFTTGIPNLERVTDKYTMIPTSAFIDDVESLGYVLETKEAPRRGLGLHAMSFSHPDLPKVEGMNLRLLATNSHDATSAFRFRIQIGVGICSNVLVAFIPALENVRVVHRGYAVEKVATALGVVRTHVDEVLAQIDAMKSRQAGEHTLREFTNRASLLRDAKPFNLFDLTKVRHHGQESNTAWNVFNRVQESLVRGGYTTIEQKPNPTNPQGIFQGPKARELTSIKERVQLNYKLWNVAVTTLL